MSGAASSARPGWVDPELATLTQDRFSDPAWIFERKLDGERCLAFRSAGQVRLMTRNKKEDTSTYPEIAGALATQQADDFIIDGEIVAFDRGQTRFALLQQRLGVRHPEPDLLTRVPRAALSVRPLACARGAHRFRRSTGPAHTHSRDAAHSTRDELRAPKTRAYIFARRSFARSSGDIASS